MTSRATKGLRKTSRRTKSRLHKRAAGTRAARKQRRAERATLDWLAQQQAA